jgi:hypothetical protein
MTRDILTLHRYFIWANRMRTHFDEMLSRDVPAEQMQIECLLYMSYWYGGLYVVIEGWRVLKLTDPTIDTLLRSPNVGLLRQYRNGTFHFQRKYFNDKFNDLFAKGTDTVAWVRNLNAEFGRYFLASYPRNAGETAL